MAPISTAHEFFKKLDGNRASCVVKKKNGDVCGHIVTSANFLSNLRYHLTRYHLEISKEVAQRDNDQREAAKESQSLAKSKRLTVDSRQQTLQQCLISKKNYDKSSPEFLKKSRALALFLGGTNVPVSIVEHPLFRQLISAMDPRFPNIGRKKGTGLVSDMRDLLNKKIRQLLLEAKRIAITTDLWTKRDQTPFMGVTAHFYGRKDHRRYNIVIALKELPHPHTGEAIYDKLVEILSDWNIDLSKIHKTVTDNASNMVKAFDTSDHNLDIDDSDTDDSDSEEVTPLPPSESSQGFENEGENNFVADFRLDESFIEGDEEAFDELQRVQESLWKKCHLRCVVHTLQLVVRKFEDDGPSKSAVKAAIRLVNRFRRSKVGQLLKKEAGKSLRVHCKTRWSSLFRMIDRLLELQVPVMAICSDKKYKIDDLRHSEWNVLSQIRQLLEPFAIHTTSLEANNSTTISLVLLALLDLQKHLQKV